MTSSMLLRDIPEDRLAQMYNVEDYYWYLRSDSFVETFLKPIGEIVNRLGLPCLDVCCGEGQLSPHVGVPYAGFDASPHAIREAIKNYGGKDKRFCVSRLETYINDGAWGTIVFGGILNCLVNRGSHIPLIRTLANRHTKYIVIYDLEKFDHQHLNEEFYLIQEIHGRAEVDGLEETKLRRKILVYRCK